MTARQIVPLNVGWQLAEAPARPSLAELSRLPESAWLDATVPGSAHGALLRAGRIPDPFYGMNEQAVQWVGDKTWVWRLRFRADADFEPHEDLLFQGLDTYCDVWLNGELLLSTDNMFVPQRVAVRDRLRAGLNELLLCFHPALERAREIEAAHGKRHLWNGDSARLYVRKAQYHFGWDWGPVLMTSGPWLPIQRQRYRTRIDDVHCRQLHATEAGGPVRVQLRTRWVGDAPSRVSHELLDPEGRPVAAADAQASSGDASLSVAEPRLWWPRGMGEQALYTLVTRLYAGDQVVAVDRRRIGLRTLRLVQQPVAGEAGTSFFFEVNGREVFIGGANWIPDDNLLERITPERYRQRVEQAAAGNMNMLRVWAGGIYEDDAFYDACDELGVLVWQDFLFACGLYPAHAEFQASVRAEAEAAVRRLRHRACLALWCGNNEDYAIAESIGAYGPQAPLGRFPARALYEELLPAVCAALDPDRPYWPGSPYSPNATGITLSSDPTVGDRHSWEVWHQAMLPYQRYADVQSRFVSEFGMQAHPSLALLERSLPEAERYPESRTMVWHNKAGSGAPDGHRRLAVYLSDNLRAGTSLADQVYATQFIQAEAMRVAYQDFRRRWQRPGARAVGGALVWQLNDCWPVTSWALIDSAGTVKPAWHAIRRAMAPLAVALRQEKNSLRFTVMNAGSTRELTLRFKTFDLQGNCRFEQTLGWTADNDVSADGWIALPDSDITVVAEVIATDARTNSEISRDCAWPEPFKFQDFSLASVGFHRSDCGLKVSATAPVKGLWLQSEGLEFEDNFIDLVPGDVRHIAVRGARQGPVVWSALDQPGGEVPEVLIPGAAFSP